MRQAATAARCQAICNYRQESLEYAYCKGVVYRPTRTHIGILV